MAPRRSRDQDDSPHGLLWTVAERERDDRGGGLQHGQEHARRDADGHGPSRAQKGGEQADQHDLAYAYPAGSEQREEAENVAEREGGDGAGEWQGRAGDQAPGQHPEGGSIGPPADHREQRAREPGAEGERLERRRGVDQDTPPGGP